MQKESSLDCNPHFHLFIAFVLVPQCSAMKNLYSILVIRADSISFLCIFLSSIFNILKHCVFYEYSED